MARELGFRPKSLMKNIPSPTQQWKMPVKDWVRSLYEKKIGPRRQPVPPPPATPAVPGNVVEFRNPEYPWPDRPEIPEHIFYDPTQSEDDDDSEEWEDPFEDSFEPPSESDVEEENVLMLRRQCLFRWAAQSIAIAMSKLPEVRKVAAFGAVAQPLEMEVPRFRQFRRHGVEVLHECADLDLAVWTADLSRLKELKRAMALGLSFVHDTPYGGVAHHQVDVHLLDAGSGDYRGRLCAFGQCPKPRKPQCLVPGCGAQTFLQQFNRFRFNRPQFEGEPKITLFDRASGYLVRAPRMEVKPARSASRTKSGGEGVRDEDVPF